MKKYFFKPENNTFYIGKKNKSLSKQHGSIQLGFSEGGKGIGGMELQNYFYILTTSTHVTFIAFSIIIL